VTPILLNKANAKGTRPELVAQPSGEQT